MSHRVAQGVSAPARMQNKPTWLISRAYARSSGTLNEAFESHGNGLRSYHYRLLSTLDESGPTGQAELGRIAGIDRSDVVAILNELEEQGLVTRTTDLRNRRRNIVTITTAGTRRLAQLEQVVSDAQETLMAPLSPTQRAQFLKLISMIIAG